MSAADPVPFLDVRAGYRELREEFDAAYRRVMDSGSYVLGPEVDAFESEFAAAAGARHAVGVASGLDALVLALRALGIEAGDAVAVPGHTFIATWLAVSAVGARPVPVDVEEATGNLDPRSLTAAMGAGIRAVIPVHLYGQPARMPDIEAVAAEYGAAVLADAAQAHGARLGGRPIGALAGVSAFSFYPGKNLGAFGDGGAIVTDDSELAARVRLLRNYGSPRKYEHELPGVNSRLDELQAAFLRVKLSRLTAWNDRRRVIAERYLGGIEPREGLIDLPAVVPGAAPSWHLFTIRSDHRDALAASLRSEGIETLVHYPTPPHRTAAYASAGPWPGVPVSERVAARTLSLPIGPHLDARAVERVITAVNRFRSPSPSQAVPSAVAPGPAVARPGVGGPGVAGPPAART